MSYVIIPPNSVNTNPDVPLGIGLRPTPDGVFRPIYIKEGQALENLKNLLLTFPGERTGDWINFGCNLKALLFEQVNEDIKIDIQDTIIDAVSTWLSYINILSIDIVTSLDDPTLDHSIRVLITFSLGTGLLEQNIEIKATESGLITIQ